MSKPKPIETPHTHAAEFIAALEKLGSVPGKWDSPGCRIFDVRNADGHPILRVVIDHEAEDHPQSISLIRFTGTVAQLIAWQSSNMSAHMPTAGLLAMIKASL